MFLVTAKLFRMWWPGTESNRRRQPFQGCALPAELPGQGKFQSYQIVLPSATTLHSIRLDLSFDMNILIRQKDLN